MGSRREESGPQAEGAGRIKEGGEESSEDPSRVRGPASSGLPRSKSALPARLPKDAYVPAALRATTGRECTQAPRVTEALAEGSWLRQGPAARRSRDSPPGHPPAAPASAAGAAGAGLPAAPRLLPRFQGDARHVNDVCLHGNKEVKKKGKKGSEAAVKLCRMS